jgi:hypothetical protein
MAADSNHAIGGSGPGDDTAWLEHDEIGLICNGNGGALPLPLGEVKWTR